MRNFTGPRHSALTPLSRVDAVALLFSASLYGQSQAALKIDLERAIQIALGHNHALRAARTQVQQSQAEKTTAAIRLSPFFTYDGLFMPIFSPSQLNETKLNTVTGFDSVLGWTYERGGFRG